MLGIDDAHWLDDGSAALIHHLTLTGVASVVVTVRLGEPAPDPVTALWKEGLAERIDVAALSRAQSAALVEAGLGGPVDGLTVERLWQFSQGNALYLRELVRGWAESGALVCTDRVWRWQGPILAPARLVELLEARIGKEPVPVRQLVELVAFGEPLDVEALRQVGIDPAIVQAAEDAGLLCSESIGAGIQVRLAHPLYGEVLRMRTTPLRARAVYASLAKTLTSVGATQPNAALRLAVWHLNAGLRCEPDVLAAGSSAALAGFDCRLAERLARSAIAAGGGMAANQALAETLVAQGQAEQAEAIFVGLPLVGVTDQVRAAVARTRVVNLHWGLGRPVDAEAVLSETEAEIADPACRDELACLRAKFLQHAGQCADAIELANKILARPKATEAAVSTSLAVRAQALTALGQYDQSVDAAQRGVEFERKRNNGLWSLAEDEVVSGSCIGYLWAGQLAPAEAVARSCYQRAVAMSWPMGTAAWAMWLGEIERARGRLTDALRWFREAAAVARGDAFRHPYWSFLDRHVLAGLVRAAAQAGESAEAAAALAGAGGRALSSLEFLDSFFGPVHAWVAAAKGEITAGTELALNAAEVARDRGHAGFEIIALHDVVRLGAPARVVRRLAELATVVEGRLAPLYATHAGALAAGDGTRLDAVAAAFAELGYLLLAAEAATQAAAAHRGGGYRTRAGASAARARALAAHCAGARTPALITLGPAMELTRRENEIARLAASGLSSRAIAERLVVAVRTVDNVLGVVYAKLGIRRRDELAAALTANVDHQYPCYPEWVAE